MPRFEPFMGLRYSPTHIAGLDDVVCPPYDVIAAAERAALVARHPANIVRLEIPDAGDGAPDPYADAARLLDAWRDGGVLRRDPAPAFYGQRMSWTDAAGRDHRTIGVIGALGLEPPGTGILPHEQTMPKAKSDRLALLRATRANLSPIWGLSPTPGLTGLIEVPEHPTGSTLDTDGVRHDLWPITDPGATAAITAAVAATPLLIADGHHRFETALAYQAEQRAADGDRPGDYDAVMALVVELSPAQLAVQAIHRLVAGLPDDFDLPAALGRWMDLVPTGPLDATIEERMVAAGSLAVVTPAGVWLGRPSPAMEAGATHDLDSSRLDVALADLPAHELVYQHGWQHAAAAVASGRAQAAVLLRPVTVDQIAAIGEGGLRMPPKTTFFWPKPRTGLVVRELVD